MRLKTIDDAGNVFLKDYPQEVCREIFLERNSYVLQKCRSYGVDYGGSHCSDGREVTCEEILPERILVKNGHFCGVCICTEYDDANSLHRNVIKEAILFADGSGAHSARSGFEFSNDDHSRWDYTDYSLTERDKAEETDR